VGALERALPDEIAAEVRRLDEEIGEIDLLIQQVLAEAERHETRRARAEDRIAALESDSRPSPVELREARGALITFTRRAMLFEAQQQVLEGKRKTLTRFRDRMAKIAADLVGQTWRPGAMPGAESDAGTRHPRPDDAARLARVRAQEDLRREIVRALHDGPAQSLANIALQAEIVQRLVGRQDARALSELGSLRRMVQHALETTKAFIFEVRPMVLDDLGLGPTLRRAAIDRSRRSGVAIDLESRGTERRLSPDLESILFRSIDDAIAGDIALHPARIVVRLDWGESELLILVETRWPTTSTSGEAARSPSSPRAAETPPALAAMIAEVRDAEHQALSASRSLPPEHVLEIADRASALGVRVAVRNHGETLEMVAPIPA
jgi:two-component system, NarL family, sensor histidine kinase DegS